MNADFVSFSLAKKLKEKGYLQAEKNALAMYNEDGEWYSLSPTLDDFYYDFRDFDDNDCVCPTISQVLKWLREEKNIHVIIMLNVSHRTGLYDWACDIVDIKQMPKHATYITSCFNKDSFNLAAIAGIEYCLDNLI